MIELLRRIAAHDADRVAVIAGDTAFTYGALADRTEGLSAGLRSAGIERFAVVSDDVPLVVALLAAGSLCGAEACVYAPDIAPEELVRQAAVFDHGTVVSTRTDLGDLEDVGALGEAGPDVLRPEDLQADAQPVGDPPQRRPLLVLTTGTTAAPRGVRHDWSRQLRRVAQLPDGAGQRWLLAYGPQQFAGLQILIHVLGTGATLVAPRERQPRAAVPAIRAHAVDHISATPTFWRFLLAELRSDGEPLPSLRQITLGGEAAPGPLLDDLAAAFPDARISHVYAGSEFGSTGSVRDARNGLPTSLLQRDETGEVALRIVDGELHVRSRAGMLGYYGEEDRPDDAWWPTGDLVEVVGDRIEFRGRKSEVINVGGVKVHPLPVEDRIAALPGVTAARVYARPNPLVGSVVAVDVVAGPGLDESAVKASVKQACADLPRAWQPRSVRVVEAIETLGGKTLRR